MTKSALLTQLKNTSGSLKLPRTLEISTISNGVKFQLGPNAPCANMQEDQAAFEAWMLLAKVIGFNQGMQYLLEWTNLPNVSSPHYGRFLFRVNNFKNLFSWFDCNSSISANYDGKKLVVNKPNGEAHSSPTNTEGQIEAAFEEDPNNLLRDVVAPKSNFILARQLPVGLFENQKKRGNEIFSASHSAIDLWALSDSVLHIFELKAPGNKKMGAVTELLFYSFFMENVLNGTFQYESASRPTNIDPEAGNRTMAFQQLERAIATKSLKRIHSHLLLPKGEIHPGITIKNYGVINLLNQAFVQKNLPICMDVLTYELSQSVTNSTSGNVISNVERVFPTL